MIILTNILLAVVGITSIVLERHITLKGSGLGIKSHLILLGIKLITLAAILGFCLNASESNAWIEIILSGTVNLIIFHFLEAFLTQKILINHNHLPLFDLYL